MSNITDAETAISERRQKLEGELDRIVDVLIKEYSPEKIILFGSLAQNKPHEWSDVDLVIIKETEENFFRQTVQGDTTNPTESGCGVPCVHT